MPSSHFCHFCSVLGRTGLHLKCIILPCLGHAECLFHSVFAACKGQAYFAVLWGWRFATLSANLKKSKLEKMGTIWTTVIIDVSLCRVGWGGCWWSHLLVVAIVVPSCNIVSAQH
eukprot:3654826-Amphidinium_carterae.1